MSLSEEINAALDKHLPAELGDRLKERLTQAHNAEVELKGTKEYLRQAREKITDLSEAVNKAGNLDKLKENLDSREREIEKKEIRIELVEAKARAAEDKAKAIQGLVATVFSNRRIVHTMTRQEPGAPDQYGNQQTKYVEEQHSTHEE